MHAVLFSQHPYLLAGLEILVQDCLRTTAAGSTFSAEATQKPTRRQCHIDTCSIMWYQARDE